MTSSTTSPKLNKNEFADKTAQQSTHTLKSSPTSPKLNKNEVADKTAQDNKSVSDKSVELTSNSNNKVKYKRPQFLRPIAPNTVSCGPSISPKKLLNDLDINSIKKTVSAPNTPVLNNNRQIINLVNSPSTKTLQFPQINLGQQIANQNVNNIPPNLP
eukprot:343759_1